jgi:hypothetical protein
MKAEYTGLGPVGLGVGCMGCVVGAAPLERAAFGLVFACWLPGWNPSFNRGGGGESVF